MTDFLPILRIIFVSLGCNFIIFGGNFHSEYWSAHPLNRQYWQQEGPVFSYFCCLLSVCDILLPLECAVKFWHSVCFILNFWDNFCNFLCKVKYGSIWLMKKVWIMVIISIRKSVHFTNCDFSATLGYYGLTVMSAIAFWWYNVTNYLSLDCMWSVAGSLLFLAKVSRDSILCSDWTRTSALGSDWCRNFSAKEIFC